MSDLTNIDLKDNADIAKAVGKALNLPVGKHRIHASMSVDATVTIGEDYEQEIWHSAEPMALLSIMANKLNEATLNAVIEEYTAALKDGTLDDHKNAAAPLKDRVTEAVRKVTGCTKRICAGKTTFKDIAVEGAGHVEGAETTATATAAENVA